MAASLARVLAVLLAVLPVGCGSVAATRGAPSSRPVASGPPRSVPGPAAATGGLIGTPASNPEAHRIEPASASAPNSPLGELSLILSGQRSLPPKAADRRLQSSLPPKVAERRLRALVRRRAVVFVPVGTNTGVLCRKLQFGIRSHGDDDMALEYRPDGGPAEYRYEVGIEENHLRLLGPKWSSGTALACATDYLVVDITTERISMCKGPRLAECYPETAETWFLTRAGCTRALATARPTTGCCGE
jgi:hypothetical protein